MPIRGPSNLWNPLNSWKPWWNPWPPNPCPPPHACPTPTLAKSSAANITMIPTHFCLVLIVIPFLASPCPCPATRDLPRHRERRQSHQSSPTTDLSGYRPDAAYIVPRYPWHCHGERSGQFGEKIDAFCARHHPSGLSPTTQNAQSAGFLRTGANRCQKNGSK
jgi:hypothetical protein